MMPSCDQIGVPIHFHSSTTSGSASLMSLRILLRVSPRQSPSSAILFEMSSDADLPWLAPDFFMFSSYPTSVEARARSRPRRAQTRAAGSRWPVYWAAMTAMTPRQTYSRCCQAVRRRASAARPSRVLARAPAQSDGPRPRLQGPGVLPAGKGFRRLVPFRQVHLCRRRLRRHLRDGDGGRPHGDERVAYMYSPPFTRRTSPVM